MREARAYPRNPRCIYRGSHSTVRNTLTLASSECQSHREDRPLARSTTRNRMNRPDRGIHSHNHQNSQQLQHQLGLDLCQLFCKQSDGRTLRCLTLYAMRSVVLVLVLPIHYTVHYAAHCTVRHTYSTVPLYLYCTYRRRRIGNLDVVLYLYVRIVDTFAYTEI